MSERKRGGLPSLSIRRPIGTIAAASVVVVIGLFFVGQLPLDLLPQIIYPQIRANVTYPGVAPEVMEEQVTNGIAIRMSLLYLLLGGRGEEVSPDA